MIFQSRFFARDFPADNTTFEHVELVDAIPNDREASLLRMREAMFEGYFSLALFIGGMEGVEAEYKMFSKRHSNIPAWPIASTGAAAGIIYDSNAGLQRDHPELRDEISYLTLMRDLITNARRLQH